jgi:hypothetical protein
MMNKNFILLTAAVIIVLALAGTLAYTMLPRSSAPATETSAPKVESPSAQVEPETAKNSIMDLIKQGKNVSCEISMPDQNSTGTTYISGQKVRSDLTINIGSKQMLSHIVGDGNYMYMWQEGSGQGTKIKFDPNTPLPSVSASAQTQSADINKQVDMKCSPWSVDNSKFDIPAAVKFTDMSQLLNSVKSSGAGVPKMDASLCDQIPDAAAKAQCLKALGK